MKRISCQKLRIKNVSGAFTMDQDVEATSLDLDLVTSKANLNLSKVLKKSKIRATNSFLVIGSFSSNISYSISGIMSELNINNLKMVGLVSLHNIKDNVQDVKCRAVNSKLSFYPNHIEVTAF